MKRKHFLIPIVILFSALLISMPLAQEKADTSAKPDTADDKSDDAKKEKTTDEDKAFDDVIEKHTVIEGLFTLYHNEKDNSVLMEIKPDQLDKIFLCGVTREAGDGFYYDSGSMQDEFPFVLKKVGKKIQFIHKNVYYHLHHIIQIT